MRKLTSEQVERARRYSAEYRAKYPDKVKVALKEYRVKNRAYFSTYMKDYYKKRHKVAMLYRARKRAEKAGLPFDLTERDIVIPSHCPVLGIPLEIGSGSAKGNSPSIDRLKPELGYVKGNVLIVSHKANTIRSNASIEELAMVLGFYSRQGV